MFELKDIEPTNSFFTANFDVLKVDGVEDPMINVNRLSTIDLDESYTALANEFVSEISNELANTKIAFYRSISESTNEFDIQESFISIVSYIVKIIAKVIRFITDLAKKATVKLMQKTSNYKFIVSHEKDFKEFKDEQSFYFEGYRFSFEPHIPNADALIVYNQSLFNDLYVGIGLTTDDIKRINSNSVPEDKYDVFRAQVLGYMGTRINISEYPVELFKIYRSGATTGTTSKIFADKKYITDTFNRVKDRDELKKQIEINRAEATKQYNNIENSVKEIDKIINNRDVDNLVANIPGNLNISPDEINNNGRLLSSDMAAQLSKYINQKINEIQQYSAIHIQAFSAKLEAIQASFNQDLNTLYQAYNVMKGFSE